MSTRQPRRQSQGEPFTQDYLNSLPNAEPGTAATYHDPHKDAHGLQMRVRAKRDLL